MATHQFDESELVALKGKVIIVTGGSGGIGRDTVKIAHQNGARVAIADWDVKGGSALADELGDHALFYQTDVSSWASVSSLFEKVYKTWGTIHVVISNAGINKESLLVDEFDPSTGALLPPDTKIIDVNLIGMAYVTKLAVHYFKKSPNERCQLVLTGSAASFIDTPPLHLYCASKAGVLGLMRSLRTQLIKGNCTINMIAPWCTLTPMLLPSFLDVWGTLPVNQPWGVAHALLLPACRPDVNGRAFFVAGHQIVDFEEGLEKTQKLWMGAKLSDDVDEGQRKLFGLLRG